SRFYMRGRRDHDSQWKNWVQLWHSGNFDPLSPSDVQLKDKIRPIDGALNRIHNIGGYFFKWNEKQSLHSGEDLGVLAHEVENVLPLENLVTQRPNGFKGVRYEKLVPLLLEGLKEEDKKVEFLYEIIEELQSELQAIKQKV
ncbi:tail fiber domain-containing protein, partial [Xanthovirga aplysinae]|uniref:tail fiber domain-containing protein n=1 Tax=Xanthovirga aplysinae TaxID=2529853 RepID=UPI0016573672